LLCDRPKEIAFALDAATGKQLWLTQVEPPFPANGRGVTYGDGRIYAHGATVMYAVDARTGALYRRSSPKSQSS
jgi:outer membrane protein assembly factor BamB